MINTNTYSGLELLRDDVAEFQLSLGGCGGDVCNGAPYISDQKYRLLFTLRQKWLSEKLTAVKHWLAYNALIGVASGDKQEIVMKLNPLPFATLTCLIEGEDREQKIASANKKWRHLVEGCELPATKEYIQNNGPDVRHTIASEICNILRRIPGWEKSVDNLLSSPTSIHGEQREQLYYEKLSDTMEQVRANAIAAVKKKEAEKMETASSTTSTVGEAPSAAVKVEKDETAA
jgi:hypothetical protein